MTVTEVNDAPVAADDAAATNEDTPVAIAVLANDSDGDSATLTPVVVSGPANGSVTVEADGSITYAPAANFNGTDSFTYKASDGAAESSVADGHDRGRRRSTTRPSSAATATASTRTARCWSWPTPACSATTATPRATA